MLGSHSNVSFSPLSETNVTLYPREVDVVVCIPLVAVAALGAIGANPWAETARRARERALANMIILFVGCKGMFMRRSSCILVDVHVPEDRRHQAVQRST